MNALNDEAVVAAFVAHLRENGYPGLSIDSRPDVHNRDSPDIDAVAGIFAIEHTSIDTIENQRRDGAWFSGIADPLEAQFRDVLLFRLRLIFPYEGIAKGQDWNAIRLALAAWISNEAVTLTDGAHRIVIPGVPVGFHATKDSHGRPGLVFVRIDPGDPTLASRVFEQLSRKAAKLQPYKAQGKTTILLVDSSDIALMSHAKMIDAIRMAFHGAMPEGIDQLWYVDTSVVSAVEFWDLTSALTRQSAPPSAEMGPGIWTTARNLFVRPLPRARFTAYLALTSSVLAFVALFYTGRVFQLERRDALLFELERRRQEYERLLLSTECFIRNAPGANRAPEDMDRLRVLSTRLHTLLRQESDADLSELLDARDDVLTVGSDAALGVTRYVMNERPKLDSAALERLTQSCSS